MQRLAFLGLAAAISASACKKDAQGDLDGAGEASGTPIDVTAFASDPDVAARVLRMPFAEAARRLGSLSFEARTFFVFGRGGEEREQSHVARVTQDASGNFHVHADSGASQVEVFLVGETLYVRQDKGHARAKPRRDANSEGWRETVWASTQEALSLFSRRLQFVDPRPETVAGRPAVRYRIVLASEGQPGVELAAAPSVLPALPISVWRERARPLAAAGSVWLDGGTGVVLKMKLEGRLEVADREVRPTQLTIRYDGAVTKAGTVASVKPPDSVPEYQRRPPPDDPISFFRDDLERAASGAAPKAGGDPGAGTPASSPAATGGSSAPETAPAAASRPAP